MRARSSASIPGRWDPRGRPPRWSFAAFSIGAFIPLIPWLGSSGNNAKIASVVLAAIAAAVVGVLLAWFTGRSPLFSAVRQVLIATLAAGVTYGIGVAIG